jgi:hypothetical protein
LGPEEVNGTVRLSYRELAARLGMSADAARIKARRRGWRVDRGNDGKATVTIQADELAELLPRAKEERAPSEPRANGERPDLLETPSSELFVLVAGLREELHEAMAAVNELAILAATEKATAAELRLALEHERQVGAEQRAELKELRRPWWVRWFPKSGDP